MFQQTKQEQSPVHPIVVSKHRHGSKGREVSVGYKFCHDWSTTDFGEDQ